MVRVVSPKAKGTSLGAQKKFWIGLCVVSSAWMFFLGLMVGRGIVPTQFDTPKIERELADLARSDTKPENKDERIAIRESDPFKAFKSRDPRLDIPKEAPVNKSRARSVIVRPTEPVKTPYQESLKTKRPSTSLKNKVPKQDGVVAPISPSSSTPSPTLTKKERFLIQAAAYRGLDEANKAVAAMQQLGYRAFVVPTETEGKKVWYRVRLGPFNTHDEANRVLQQLGKNRNNAFIIQQ